MDFKDQLDKLSAELFWRGVDAQLEHTKLMLRLFREARA